MNASNGTKPSGAPGLNWGSLLAKAGLALVYCTFLVAHVTALREQFRLSLALLVVFESVMLAMVLVRRDQVDVDYSAVAIVAGLAGSFMGLAFRPVAGADDYLIGQLLQVAGTVMQLGAAMSLGRSFGMIPANRGIKTGGMYRLVRHPFYFSYLIVNAGYVINNPSVANVAFLAVGLAFQVLRIRYEERLLMAAEDYRRYIESVRWHLVPGVW